MATLARGLNTGRIPCGFCGGGNHDRCPRGFLNSGRIWVCPCPAYHPQPLRCITCNTYGDDSTIHPELYRCRDLAACERDHANRLSADPTVQIVREVRARVTERKTIMADDVKTKKTPAKAAKDCTCNCGGKTKGGTFLPGHDARHISALVNLVLAQPAQEGEFRNEVKGLSEALQKKFEKSLALALAPKPEKSDRGPKALSDLLP